MFRQRKHPEGDQYALSSARRFRTAFHSSLTTEENREYEKKFGGRQSLAGHLKLNRERGFETKDFEVHDQARKGARWMPWHRRTMKDAVSCDKPRGVAHTL